MYLVHPKSLAGSCGYSSRDCAPTWQAASHVISQKHAIRTGTGELGGAGVDLWSRQAQVLAATVGEGRSLTPVHSWGRRGLQIDEPMASDAPE